ncbi:hypothetical protein D3C86_2027580 [compost metagenome]
MPPCKIIRIHQRIRPEMIVGHGDGGDLARFATPIDLEFDLEFRRVEHHTEGCACAGPDFSEP